MAQLVTWVRRLCEYALSVGAEAIEVEQKDDGVCVFARSADARFRIAKYPTSSADARDLCRNLSDLARKPVRAVLGGRASLLTVEHHERSGEDGFEITITTVPPRDPATAPSFTEKQGQYLAFIYHYAKIHRQAPAEFDLQRYFGVSPPSVHNMLKILQRDGLIERTPGQARSIRLLVLPEHLPALK